MTSTIFAKASGSGRAGVAVYRLSGPQAGPMLEELTGALGSPRQARRVSVHGPNASMIDDGLALWFPAPRSFTGEDVAELHLHGSIAVERQLTKAVLTMGAELAGPGAFTWRAFENGKLDLTQVEGLADLLEAETELQHKQALAGYRGALRDRAEEWRADLIRAMAVLEAAVDFPEEEDVPAQIADRALPIIGGLKASLAEVLRSSETAQRLSDGLTIALVGPPNAGKSSLFNALVREERAIVSPEAGTTRDVVSATVEMAGLKVTFLDLAGIRNMTGDMVEAEGIERARRAAETADVRLLCWPASDGNLPGWMGEFTEEHSIIVRTKDDSVTGPGVSIFRGMSVERLRTQLAEQLATRARVGLAPTDRQQHLIQAAYEMLVEAEEVITRVPELGAEALRRVSSSLEELTGRIVPDQVLGDIFSSFCIGK